MTGRLKTADQLKEAVILRDGGYSLAAIAVKTGISASTLSRHFKKIGAAKGGLTEPRPGWVRSDKLASSEASEEILRLHRLVETKDEDIKRLNVLQSASIEGLAHGSDQVELSFNVSTIDPTLSYHERNYRFASERIFTWDDVYKSFAPQLLTPVKISSIKSGINSLIRESELDKFQEMHPDLNISTFTVSNSSLQMVIVQFAAMGFLDISNAEDKDGKPYKLVVLTPHGRSYLLNVSAVRRGQLAKAAPGPSEADSDHDD